MCETDEKQVDSKDASLKQQLTQRLIRKYIEQMKQRTEVELKPSVINFDVDGFTTIRIIMKAKIDRVKKERRPLVPVILSADSIESE